MIEDAYQRNHGHVGYRLIPVVKNDIEWRLAHHGADDGAESDGHPQQHGKAPAEVAAAERSENDQDAHSQAKADEHLGRSQFSWQIREQRQDSNSHTSWFSALREIIAAERNAKKVRLARHGRNACPIRRHTGAPGVDERSQNRQRQIRIMRFDRLIEPFGKLALA